MVAVWLFLALAVPAFAQDTDVPLSAFEADAECPSGGEADCALHALQRRAQEGGNANSAAKEGGVARPGTEEPINDEGEVVYDPNVVLPDPSLAEEEAEGEDQDVDDGEKDKDLSQLERESGTFFSRRRGTPASTPTTGKSMCCKCRNGVVSWSASGTCSHCSSSGISQRKTPSSQCQSSSSPSFPGNSLCAQRCGTAFGGSTGGSGGIGGGSCPTATSGTCKIMGCSSSRGGKAAVACVKGKCVCKAGYCSNGSKCTRR